MNTRQKMGVLQEHFLRLSQPSKERMKDKNLTDITADDVMHSSTRTLETLLTPLAAALERHNRDA